MTQQAFPNSDDGFTRQVIEMMVDGIAVCHETGDAPFVQFTIWNPAMRELTGYTFDEINQLGWYQTVYVDPVVQSHARERMERMRRGEDLVREEWSITHKDGSPRTVEISTRVIKVHEGQPHVMAVMRDITEHKRREAEVHAARSHLAATLNAVPDLLFEVGLDGRYYSFHSPRAELLAAPPEKLIGNLVADILPPEAAAVCLDALREAHAQGRSNGRQFELALPQGRLWFELSVSRKTVDAGQAPRFIVLSRDITQRKQSELALAEHEMHLRTLIEAVPDAIQFKDGDGRWLVANSVCLRAFGLLNKRWQGLTDAEIGALYPELAAALAACKKSDDLAWQTNCVSRSEEHFTDAGGASVRYEVAKIPLFDPQHIRQAMVIVSHDCTERMRAERNIKMAVDAAQVLLWEFDLPNDRFIYDHGLLPMLGLETAHAPDGLRAWAARVHPEERSAFEQAIASALQPGDPTFDYEYRMADLAGDYHWVHTKGKVVQRDEAGNPLLAVGVTMNISARKQAEAAMQESEAQSRKLAALLRLMCDNVPDMIWAKDLDKRYIFANKAIVQRLLRAADTDEPLGNTDMFFAARERASRPDNPHWHTFGELCQDSDAITLARDCPSVFEEFGNVGGRFLSLEVHKAPFRDEAGAVIGTVGSARDITERRRREALLGLLESLARATNEAANTQAGLEECLRRICAYGAWSLGHLAVYHVGQTTATAPASFWHCDGKSRFDGFIAHSEDRIYASPGGQFVGVAARERHAVWLEDIAKAYTFNRQRIALDCGIAAGFVFPVFIGDELVCFLEFFATETRPPDRPLIDSIGVVAGQLGRLIERGRAAQKLAELNAELEIRVARRTAELQAANKELDSFSYTIAHDMRAPVRAINGFSELVLQHNADKLDALTLGHLQRIVAGSRHMSDLIDDLLNLARLSRQEMKRQRFNLASLAEGVLAAMRAAQPARRIEITVQPEMPIDADPGLMRAALDNLIGNAWKFTAKTALAKIDIGIEARDGVAVYFVRDNGAGFEMKYAHKLFAPFQRLHHASEFEGTGIGLATVRKIIDRHGGKVWLDSAAGLGTTAFFTVGDAS